MQHSRIGASSAYRWFACPGSVKLSGKVPPSPSSVFAEEGTAAHELAEHCILKGVRFAKDCIGLTFNSFTVDEPMAEAVQVYLDTIINTLDEHKVLRVEERFNLDWIHKDLFGTNDALIMEPFGTLTILDYKHGQGIPVEVEENKQLMYYGVGALRQAVDCEDVEFVIVQPRAQHSDGPVRRWRTTLSRMAEFEAELKEKAEATENPQAPLQAGEHCRFCPAQGICPELKKQSLAVARAEFSDGVIALPEVETLTAKDITEVLNGRSMLEAWLKAVYVQAERMAANGEKIPGYKLVQKKGNRKWIDEKLVTEKFFNDFGGEIYQPQKLKSPAQLEKVVGKGGLSDLVEIPITGETLVLDSDKRKAIIKTSFIEEFI